MAGSTCKCVHLDESYAIPAIASNATTLALPGACKLDGDAGAPFLCTVESEGNKEGLGAWLFCKVFICVMS